jgi:hypothetical protein
MADDEKIIINIQINKKNVEYLLMDLRTIYIVKEPFPITKKLIKVFQKLENK